MIVSNFDHLNSCSSVQYSSNIAPSFIVEEKSKRRKSIENLNNEKKFKEMLSYSPESHFIGLD